MFVVKLIDSEQPSKPKAFTHVQGATAFAEAEVEGGCAERAEIYRVENAGDPRGAIEDFEAGRGVLILAPGHKATPEEIDAHEKAAANGLLASVGL